MQDRAKATRKRLLDATFQSLVEKGYAGTTTREVCRRINASRGTLLHHFSTREELVIAAVEHVLEQNVAGFEQTMARLSQGNPTLAELARALWEEHWSDDPFYALMELVMASRTDPLLNERVREMSQWWIDKFSEAFEAVMGRKPDGAYWLFFMAFNALSMEKLHRDPQMVKQALEDLLALVELADRFFIRFGEKNPLGISRPDNKKEEDNP